MPIKIVFMGTPDFAVPALQALITSTQPINAPWRVVGVVTQPDRPSGRGKILTPPPVKVAAQKAGVMVFQPATLRQEAAVAQLAALEPDLIVVAAFGQILRKNVLNMPPHGCINIHASLLPRWRGASPITAAIHAGDTATGITLMQMDEGLDTGPIIAQKSVPIMADHTGGTLTDQLAHIGATLLIDTLPAWLAGRIKPQPQDNTLATLAPRLKKEDGAINWHQSATEIVRQVRALSPWPGTYTLGPKGPIKIINIAISSPDEIGPYPAGTIFKRNKQVQVAAGQGIIRLITVQPAGKKAMAAEAMLNGQPNLWESVLGAGH